MLEVSNVEVHASHCCLRHGCKYGDENCPVENGRVVQEYPCEQCSYEKEEEDEKDKRITELETQIAKNALRDAVVDAAQTWRKQCQTWTSADGRTCDGCYYTHGYGYTHDLRKICIALRELEKGSEV